VTYLTIPFALVALSLGKPSTQAEYDRVLEAAAVVDRIVEEEIPLFDGSFAELRTGMLMLSIAQHESGMRHDAVGFDPRDVGCMQVRAGAAWASYTRKEVLGSFYVCFRVGLNALRIAKGACHGVAWDWLTGYASGRCGYARGVARELCAPVGVCEAS
jgi:hypothetical protein